MATLPPDYRVEGRTRDEWRALLADNGISSESIEEMVAVTFGDSVGDVVRVLPPGQEEKPGTHED